MRLLLSTSLAFVSHVLVGSVKRKSARPSVELHDSKLDDADIEAVIKVERQLD